MHSRPEVFRTLFVWWLLYLLQNVDLILLTDPLCHVAIVLKQHLVLHLCFRSTEFGLDRDTDQCTMRYHLDP